VGQAHPCAPPADAASAPPCVTRPSLVSSAHTPPTRTPHTAIRGTKNASDVITDISGSTATLDGGRVHWGMLQVCVAVVCEGVMVSWCHGVTVRTAAVSRLFMCASVCGIGDGSTHRVLQTHTHTHTHITQITRVSHNHPRLLVRCCETSWTTWRLSATHCRYV
jgi:hypothetical protein